MGAPGGLDHARRGRSSSALIVRDPLQLVGERRGGPVGRDERGAVGGFLYRGQVDAGRAGCREHDEPVGGVVGGTGYERGTLGVRGDVLLWVALQASLMAECFADGAGDSEGGIGVSELVGASHVSEHAADGDFGCVALDALRVDADLKGIAFISSQVIVSRRVSSSDELATIKE